MVTHIVIKKGWKTIKSYPYLITLSKGDAVCFDFIEYTVVCCLLDLDEDKFTILIRE